MTFGKANIIMQFCQLNNILFIRLRDDYLFLIPTNECRYTYFPDHKQTMCGAGPAQTDGGKLSLISNWRSASAISRTSMDSWKSAISESNGQCKQLAVSNQQLTGQAQKVGGEQSAICRLSIDRWRSAISESNADS